MDVDLSTCRSKTPNVVPMDSSLAGLVFGVWSQKFWHLFVRSYQPTLPPFKRLVLWQDLWERVVLLASIKRWEWGDSGWNLPTSQTENHEMGKDEKLKNAPKKEDEPKNAPPPPPPPQQGKKWHKNPTSLQPPNWDRMFKKPSRVQLQPLVG